MDVRTVAVMLGAVNVLLAVVLVAQVRFNRGYPGLGWWAAGQVAVAAGMVGSALRGASLAGHVAIPIYQALLVGGSILILIGAMRFLGRREPRGLLAAVWLAPVAWSTYFTFVDYQYTLRTLGLFLTSAVVLAWTSYVLWRHHLAAFRGSAIFTAAVFAVGAAAYVALAVAELLRGPVADALYTPTPVNIGAFLASMSTVILWTFGLVLMINERLAASIALEARNMHSIFSTGPDCAIISRLDDGAIDDVNDGFTTLTGFSRDEAVGRTTLDLGLWVEPGLRLEYVDRVAVEGALTDFAMLMRRKDGTAFDCLLSSSSLTLDDQPYMITVARDVTVQRRMEAQLLHEATTDSLTGLPNRRHFLSVCERELRRASRSTGPVAVAVVDMDHFKDINDLHGHATGDAAIIAFAEAVTSRIRDIDTFGRLGGDEFGLLFPDADLDRAAAAVERVRVALTAEPLLIDGHRMTLTFSAGVAVNDGPADTVDELIARADRALYDAKERGRNRVEPHSREWRDVQG